MMIKMLGGVAALVLAFGTAARAAPATPEEAQRLTTLLERYVGHPAGQASAVTVAPHGESYTATLDVSRLLGFMGAAGYAVTASPVVAELTPQDDGRWHVVVDGLPIVGFTKADQAFSMSIKGYKLDGLFDPKIQTFASATTTSGGSVTHGNGPKGTMDVRLTDTGIGTTTATDAGAGTADIKSGSSIKDFTYSLDSLTTPDAPGGEGQKLAFTAHGTDLTTAVAIGNARVGAIEDLWAFLVAHPSKEALVAAQPDLKTKLRALLPLTSSTVGDLKLSNLSVTTDKGLFGAAEFDEHYAFGGSAGKDSIATTLTLAGLALPSNLVPAWATPLVPTGFAISQSYGPLNLTPALTMMIDDVDLSADKPLTPDQQVAIAQTFGQNEMTVTIAPSTISTALMTVSFEGDVHMTKPMPTGTATVSVKGLDKTIETIRAGTPDDPNAEQAINFLSAMKILAKAEGLDSYSWHVVAAPGAPITVNGNPLGASAASATPAPDGAPGPALQKPKARKKKPDQGGDQGHVTIPAQ